MTISPETIAHLKRWESCRLVAYPDPGLRDGTPWTIGYGHTSDGNLKVYKGLKITQAQAEYLLIKDAEEAEAAVKKHVKVPLTDNQLAALVAFTMNLGEGKLAGSTLLKRLNAGDYAAVPGELMRWVHNDGKVMQGLVNRRKAEGAMWTKGDAPALPSKPVADSKPAQNVTKNLEPLPFFARIIATLVSIFFSRKGH